MDIFIASSMRSTIERWRELNVCLHKIINKLLLFGMHSNGKTNFFLPKSIDELNTIVQRFARRSEANGEIV